jgi:hypothetical protein
MYCVTYLLGALLTVAAVYLFIILEEEVMGMDSAHAE